MEKKVTASAILLALFLVTTGLVLIVTRDGGSINLSDLSVHDPIFIEGNKGFTEENGVVSGLGTEEDPYIIADWMIECGLERYGILVANSTAHFIVRNCQISGWSEQETEKWFTLSRGVEFRNVVFGTLKGCSIVDTWAFEISVKGSDHCVITENTCRSDKGAYSIGISMCNDLKVSYNTCDALIDPLIKMGTPAIQFHKDYGLLMSDQCSKISIKNNFFKNYLKSGINGIIEYGYGIVIDGNKILNCEHEGIIVIANELRIINNIISDCPVAIDVCKKDFLEISYNNCSKNSDGIRIQGFGEGSLGCHDNIIEDNKRFGISSRSVGTDIYNNSIKFNGERGIVIGSYYNLVKNNIIQGNGEHGVSVEKYPYDEGDDFGLNKVYSNDFIDNVNMTQALDNDLNVPIAVYKGEDFYSWRRNNWTEEDPYPDVVIFFENHSFIAYAGPAPNYWYDASIGGNFWSNHNTPDEDGDGYIDTNYSIPGLAGSVDEMPLSSPVDIDVKGPTIVPHILGDPVTSLRVGDFYSDIFSATDLHIRSGKLQWSLSSNADWLSLNSNNDLKGNPTYSGVFWVNVSVMDGDEIGFQNFTLLVKGDDNGGDDQNPPDEPPDNSSDDNNTRPLAKFKNPPTNLSIVLPSLVFKEGGVISLIANSSDPDESLGDLLSFEWGIDGIGIIGYGRAINYTLTAGTYVVKLTVSDRYGNNLSTTEVISVERRSRNEEGHRTLDFVLFGALALVTLLLLLSLFFLRKRGGPLYQRQNDSEMDRPLRERSTKNVPVKDGPLAFETMVTVTGQKHPLGAMDDISLPYQDSNLELSSMKNQILSRGPSTNKERRDLLLGIDSLMEDGKISRNTHKTISKTLKVMVEE